jgi:AhpD family alkylhydroperoxidase
MAPWTAGEHNRSSLRAAGLSEGEALHVVLGCAVFNYLNRMADGLGIECEYRSPLPPIEVPVEPGDGAITGSRRDLLPVLPRLEPSEHAAGRPGAPRSLFTAMAGNPEARDRAQAWRSYQLAPTPGLDARMRARIALRVSRLNRCAYSAAWFAEQLAREGGEEATRTPRNELLLEHAERLTRAPWTVRAAHLATLRAVGLDDLAILRLTMLASYVSFENRAVFGLGVELEAAG